MEWGLRHGVQPPGKTWLEVLEGREDTLAVGGCPELEARMTRWGGRSKNSPSDIKDHTIGFGISSS